MWRLLICLPVCLLLAPDRADVPSSVRPIVTSLVSEDPLPTGDAVTFLEKCVERYDQAGIRGYRTILQKQERIGGKLQPTEEIEVFYREQPHSVFFHWLKGQRKADSALYVQGENDDKLLVHPSGVAGKFVKVVSRDPEGEDAKQSGRYSLREFGLKKAAVRTFKAWQRAKDAGTLKVEYLGVRKVKETGDRLCYTLRRTCPKPEDDGYTEVTLYIDKETWFQVGSVLKDAEGRLVGEYMFRDIQLNPTFVADQFTRAAVAR